MTAEASPVPLVVRASAPLRGKATVPGDKSISHRALIFGALSVGETRISGLLEGEDVIDTAKAMRAFGAEVTRHSEGAWSVHGVGVGGFAEGERHAGQAGQAVAQLVVAVRGRLPGPLPLRGPRAGPRPSPRACVP